MSEPQHVRSSKRFGRPAAEPAAVAPDVLAELEGDEVTGAPIGEWNTDMEDAPRDGRPVWLTSDFSDSVEAVWRTTRAYDAARCRFVDTAFWALACSGGQRLLGFVPAAWRFVQ